MTAMRFYNDTNHRQCSAVDEHGLDCAAPEGHVLPHANVNGEWTTMTDLYPDGRGYHDAHEPYIAAVAQALNTAGLVTEDWHADPNDPRDGAIELDMDRQGTIDGHPVWSYDEVWVGWSEDRGWHLLCIDDRGGRDSRYVFELAVARVASPVTVALAVAEKAGLTLELADDGHPDLDFDHSFEDDDVPFEMALRHYAR